MGVTFHRAFDRTSDPFAALEDVIATGCERILTSGQLPNCLDGSALITELRKQADDRIIIMPGSGLKSSNIIDVAKATGATEFHASARAVAKLGMGFVVQAMNEDLQSVTVDADEVKKMVGLLRQYQFSTGHEASRTAILR
jgi:copper homeostasis protein